MPKGRGRQTRERHPRILRRRTYGGSRVTVRGAPYARAKAAPINTLYYGDNLDVLRRHIGDEAVDLVYLDPPFNSQATYNVLFREQSGERAAAQIRAFEDTWTWDTTAAAAFEETVQRGGRVASALLAFRQFLGDRNNMLAYLSMMAPRLIELRRVLKDTGSIYLHCDSTASHYLKMLMDSIFGPENFRNEIIWQRTNAHNFKSRCFARVHDVLLFYTKMPIYTWNMLYTDYSPKQLSRFKRDKNGRLYKAENLTMWGGSRNFEWRGTRPPANRSWGMDKEDLERLWAQGRILKKRDGAPRLDGWVIYLDELEGKPVMDIWTDISRVGNTSHERLGYPTQKPLALLDRVIQASTNRGDLVLDPFCGCGTAIESAEHLGRRWIGIDITHLAISLIRHRLRQAFRRRVEYEVLGEPVSLPDAKTLATQDPYQFQWWALGLVDARPVEQKRGADKGIDGRLYFHDEAQGGKTKLIVLSVKAGHVTRSQVHELRGVMEREGAEIGVFISMEEPTQPMKEEAANAGFYTSPWTRKKYARLQLLTIAELLAGKKIDYPPHGLNVTFKRAVGAKPVTIAVQEALDAHNGPQAVKAGRGKA